MSPWLALRIWWRMRNAMRGKALTVAALELYGVRREPGPPWWPWWPMSESDISLRARCAATWQRLESDR